MKVFLLRHGQSEARAASDTLRHLTAEGRNDIRDIAEQFVRKQETIDCCFSSPYLRAEESARIFLDAAGLDCELQFSDLLTPEKPAREVLAFLHTIPQQNILLVAHNPLLTALQALFTSGVTDHRMKILAAGELCCVSFELLDEGLGESLYCLSPGTVSS